MMNAEMNRLLDQLAAAVGAKLNADKKILATAESCTGGGIAEAITRISGCSAWFDRAFITYSNQAKMDMLGVKKTTLESVGAVSETVAREMAEAALARSRADVTVAVTGVAGPHGGSPDKPVGTVWFAWASKNNSTVSECCVFLGDRAAVRHQTIIHALTKLLHN